MVYVPCDAQKQNKDQWADRSVELPRTDGRNGTVENVACTGVEGDLRGLSANFSQEASFNSVPGLDDAERQAFLTGIENKPSVMLAYGSWDFGMNAVKTFGEGLTALGYTYSELEVPAAHDWECWQLTYAWALQNFLFQ